MSRGLCVFARAAHLGRVKQRLAARLGETGALDAHLDLLGRTLARCRSNQYQMVLWLAGDRSLGPGPIDATSVELRWQQGDDLGQRMSQSLEATLQTHASAVLIGSDCPTIDAAYVTSAFDALEGADSADVVIGPAEDGGYGLIGLKKPFTGTASTLFSEIPWGTSGVLSTTLARAADAGLGVCLLDRIWDVDTYPGWQRYQQLKCSDRSSTASEGTARDGGGR